MPLPPYHLGPNTLFGLLFRKWLDVPVFVLAGLAVDLEVIVVQEFCSREYVPRYGHTLLVGAAIGAGLAVATFPFRRFFQHLMKRAGMPCETGFVKMLISGVLGAWLHVFIDGLYRTGVGVFWPLEATNPFCRFGRGEVESFCIICLVGAIVIYSLVVRRRSKHSGAA